MIEGVVLTALETHHDERGFFREIIRYSALGSGEKFGQLSHSLVLAYASNPDRLVVCLHWYRPRGFVRFA